MNEIVKRIHEQQVHSDYQGREYLAELQAELDHAKIVPSKAVSQEIVTMNSIVVLLDLATRKEETYTLVFPEDADIGQGKISVVVIKIEFHGGIPPKYFCSLLRLQPLSVSKEKQTGAANSNNIMVRPKSHREIPVSLWFKKKNQKVRCNLSKL